MALLDTLPSGSEADEAATSDESGPDPEARTSGAFSNDFETDRFALDAETTDQALSILVVLTNIL